MKRLKFMFTDALSQKAVYEVLRREFHMLPVADVSGHYPDYKGQIVVGPAITEDYVEEIIGACRTKAQVTKEVTVVVRTGMTYVEFFDYEGGK